MILLTSAPVSARLGVPSTKKHAPRVGELRRRGSNVRRDASLPASHRADRVRSDGRVRDLSAGPALAVGLGLGPRPHALPYIMMIIGIYATLGVFLLLASRDPLAKA